MRLNGLKSIVKAAVLGASVLLLGASMASAQQQINLTAGPSTTTLPDGSAVPMWGYTCGTAAAGSTATCVNLKAVGWSPVVITVPTGATGGLTINLTNNLAVPTSITIVGQLGGGLGAVGSGCTGGGTTCTNAPDHSNAQGATTWPIAGGPGASAPAQAKRAQSFSTEVAPGATTLLAAWATLRPGTYLIESGTHPSIQGPMGLYGILVVTTAPAGTTAGTAYPAVGTVPAVTYSGDVDLLFSEIDPVQNKAVNAAVTTDSFSETMVWSGQPGGCGNPSSSTYHQCYPPAVNYTPLYYLINGVGFSRSNASASLFPVGTAGATIAGNVLVRLVNAGLRMHVPSIVGSLTTPPVATTGVTATPVPGFSLIAEDGNALPGASRVQSEVFMAAGKTHDVMIDAPAAGGTALPVYDRELSLSGNSTARDAGMLAYLGVNGGGLPAAPVIAGAVANPDTYNSLIAGQTFTVSDPGKGVIANDVNVYGVTLIGTVAGLTLNSNGTFTYLGAPTTFSYCANGSVNAGVCSSGVTATVTLGAGDTTSAVACAGGSYNANTSSYLAIKTPGVLASCMDSKGYSLTATAFTGSGVTVVGDANGGFTATLATPCTAAGGCPTSFTFQAKNSQGLLSAAATVNVTFPAGSGLAVKVLDGADKTTEITDYRWIIEEDRTFYVDPNCTINVGATGTPPAGCPSQTSTGGVPPNFGVNFDTSYMPLVAAGCTGPLSCEGGQTVFDPATGTHVLAVCDVGNGVCRPDPSGGNGFAPLSTGSVHLDPTKRYYISVLPGDAANPFIGANGSAPANCSAGSGVYNPTNNSGLNTSCGHGMGGVPVPALPAGTTTYPTTPYTILTQPTPFPPAQLSVFVFEDDFPLNGEHDAGGGTGAVNTTNEPGLGGFEITLFDDAGGSGDATGQLTHDMFNQPLSNGLAGTIDPLSGLDACPITKQPLGGMDTSNGNAPGGVGIVGITGRIVTCPEFEADGSTPSPLAGQAVIPNMMQGRYGVVATPPADRIARGEEWLQTNTLDGQKAHDSFLRIGEPSYFQEYGP